MATVGDDLIDLERMIVRIRGVSVDTGAAECCLASLRHRCSAVRDDVLSKLSKLMTAVSTAVACEREHKAILKWMKDAENQLQALDGDCSSLAEDRHQQQEVQIFV